MSEETIAQIIKLLIAVSGGGLVGYFLIPEKKQAKRLDMAESLIRKYDPIIERLDNTIKELKADNKSKDRKIEELTNTISQQNTKISELETRMRTMSLIGQEDKALRCENMACKKRRPPLNKEALQTIANV